jgi:hypothetical protein
MAVSTIPGCSAQLGGAAGLLSVWVQSMKIANNNVHWIVLGSGLTLTLSLAFMAAIYAGFVPALVPSTYALHDVCRPLVTQIEEPGRYCLQSDRIVPEGVRISADDVEIDLAGFCLRHPDEAANRATGITIASGRQRVVVRAGCISNYLAGIYAEKGSRDIRLSGLLIEGSTFRGALLEADDVTFTGNVIHGVGGTSVYEDASTMGLDLRGDDCRISANLVSDVLPVGVGEGVGIAVGGNKCTLRDNVVVNRTRPEWGRTYGMTVNVPASLVQNVSVGQTYGFALTAGTQAPAGNIAYGEACGIGATDCPDNVSLAMKRMNPAVPPSLFIVGRAFHKAKDYPSAAIYYLAAAKRGIAEGERIVKRHLQAGYITPEDRSEADRKSDALLTGEKPVP